MTRRPAGHLRLAAPLRVSKKSFKSPAEAQGQTEKLIATKKREGYIEINPSRLEITRIKGSRKATDKQIKALEEIDAKIVAPLHEALKTYGQYRILVSPDHPTPIRLKTHSHGYVPFAICGTAITADASMTYDEPTAAQGPAFDEGWRLMRFFLK